MDKDGNFRETVMNRLRDAAQEWILLAQFDSDVDTGVLWGDDGGRIYYLIRKADMKNGNLEKAVYVFDAPERIGHEWS